MQINIHSWAGPLIVGAVAQNSITQCGRGLIICVSVYVGAMTKSGPRMPNYLTEYVAVAAGGLHTKKALCPDNTQQMTI